MHRPAAPGAERPSTITLDRRSERGRYFITPAALGRLFDIACHALTDVCFEVKSDAPSDRSGIGAPVSAINGKAGATRGSSRLLSFAGRRAANNVMEDRLCEIGVTRSAHLALLPSIRTGWRCVTRRPPFQAVRDKNDPAFLPVSALAYRRDL